MLAIVLRSNTQLIIQRYEPVLDAEQPTINRIETIGDVGKQQWPLLLEQCRKGKRQHFVRTIANKHVVGRDLIALRECLSQHRCFRIRIQPQIRVHGSVQCCQDLRRWRKRILVGIQLQPLLGLGLLTRNIGLQRAHQIAPIRALLTHDIPLSAIIAAALKATRPTTHPVALPARRSP